MNLNTNKFRTGYAKVVAALDSCESWEQFACWDILAQNFFSMVTFWAAKWEKQSRWQFWYRKEVLRWLDEAQWMLNDITTRRQAFYDYNMEQQKAAEAAAPKHVVITGFAGGKSIKRKHVRRKKSKLDPACDNSSTPDTTGCGGSDPDKQEHGDQHSEA